MAGDWIKIEHVTPDKPEVVRIAFELGIDQDAVVGKLIRLWIWADQNSVDGNALTVTEMFIDRITFVSGFAKSLISVGWLLVNEGDLSLPNFNRHNGQTAKARAVTNRRVSKHRNKCNDVVTLEPLQKPLPEKRREDINANINKRPKNLEEVISAGFRNGVLKDECEAFWHHFESTGWIDKNGHEVQNWQSKLVMWKNYKLNQKNSQKSMPMASVKINEEIHGKLL